MLDGCIILIRYMDNELKDLYTTVQDLISIEPGEDPSRVGFMR